MDKWSNGKTEQLTINPEFRDKIPALTAEEFAKLKENIIADGEVREPLVVWNNTIIDGHHRWKIIQKHPEIPYKVKRMDFADKWAAIAWMCRNQLGRRNLTDAQKTYLIGKQYEAQKLTQGTRNQYVQRKSENGHSDHFQTSRTLDKIAKEHGVGAKTVQRAERFAKGLDDAERISPGIKEQVLTGALQPPKKVVAEIRNMPEDQKRETVERIKSGKHLECEKPEPVKTNNGRSAKIRETYSNIEKASAALYDTEREVVYTSSDLEQELKTITETLTSQINRALVTRSSVLSDPGARDKISAVLRDAESKLKEMREHLP